MTTQEIVKSNKLRTAAAVLGVIILMLVSFAAGVGVGLRKAKFSYRWGENYERNFVGPMMPPPGPMGMMRGFDDRDFRNPHGLAGEIISIADNKLVVKDVDNKENTIVVTDKTIIHKQRDTIKLEDLNVNDHIVVLGKPDDNGLINANFIRVFDKGSWDFEN